MILCVCYIFPPFSGKILFFLKMDNAILQLVGLTNKSYEACQRAYNSANQDLNHAANMLLSDALNSQSLLVAPNATKSADSINSISLTEFSYILIIPTLRLRYLTGHFQHALGVEFKEIFRCTESLSIPGGVVICQLSSFSLPSLEYVINDLENDLGQYKMSTMITADGVVDPAERTLFQQQISSHLYDVVGVSQDTVHGDFHMNVIVTPK